MLEGSTDDDLLTTNYPQESTNGPWRPPLWLAALAAVLFLWLTLFYVPLFFGTFPHTIDALDFAYYYVGARIGLDHGWSRIYDLGLQRTYFNSLRPSDAFDWRRYFISPPPVAWLVAPLARLPLDAAYWIWTAVAGALFLSGAWLAAPGRWLEKAILVALGAGLYPVLISFQAGQVTTLVGAAVLLAWWLLRAGREQAAGALLMVLVLKPQVALLVPMALLASGRRRLFVTWLAGVALVTIAALLSLGVGGTGDLLAALAQESGRPANTAWTLAVLLPIGAEIVVGLAAGLVAMVVARSADRPCPEVAIVAGCLATLLVFPYHNASDYMIVAVAGWLHLRAFATSPLVWMPLLAVVGCYLAAPLGSRPLLVATSLWLLSLLWPVARGAPHEADRLNSRSA